MFSGHIMKLKNVCHVRHALTDDNPGPTHDIISRRTPRKIRIPTLTLRVAEPLYCNDMAQLNKSFIFASENATAIRNACVYPLVNSWFVPFQRFINAHYRRANVTKNFPYNLTNLYLPKWTMNAYANVIHAIFRYKS